jgi:hypothetical protein
MPGSRYGFSIDRVAGKDTSGIYFAASTGALKCKAITMNATQRLDTLSGLYYGDSQYWWIIAAASGIGWGLQVPPGTLIRIPLSVSSAQNLVR